MGNNPFSSIQAKVKSTPTFNPSGISNSSASAKNIANINKEYDSIFKSIDAKTGNLKASIKAEVAQTNRSIERQQRKQAIIGIASSLATTLPEMANIIVAIKAVKNAKTQALPASEMQTQLSQFQTAISQAQNKVSELNTQIADLSFDVKNLENKKIENESLSVAKQKEIDSAKDEESRLQSSLDNETDEQLISINDGIKNAETGVKSAKTQLDKANAMPEGEAKEKALKVANEALKLAEEQKSKLENQKEERKSAIKKLISEQKTKRKEAIDAKAKADEAVESAKTEIEQKKAELNEKIMQKNALNSQTTQLQGEVVTITQQTSAKEQEEQQNRKTQG